MEYFFELSDRSQVATAWFISWTGGDFMGMVFRDDAYAPWRFVSRIRRCVDDKDPFESHDEKYGYEIRAGADEASKIRMLHSAEAVVIAIGARTDSRTYRVDVNGSAEDFTREWSKQPFVHVKFVGSGPKEPQ